MIKGVTKKIIEINNPNSIYFEKAVFYLRPEVRQLPEEISRREASEYISKLGLEYTMRRKRLRFGKILIYGLLAASITTLAVIFII